MEQSTSTFLNRLWWILAVVSFVILVHDAIALLRGEPDERPHEHVRGVLFGLTLLMLAAGSLVRRVSLKSVLFVGSFVALAFSVALRWI